jgi:hypothetical protein
MPVDDAKEYIQKAMKGQPVKEVNASQEHVSQHVSWQLNVSLFLSIILEKKSRYYHHVYVQR